MTTLQAVNLLGSNVEITGEGMRHGCVGVLEAVHSDLEFKIRFQDERFSYFLASELKQIDA